MKIDIPNSLDLCNSLKLCERLESIKNVKDYTYDYCNMGTVEPFGMLLVGSKIRMLNEDSKHREINFENKMYAANMGYFYSVFRKYGKKPENLRGNNNFMPIKKINIRDSYRDAFDTDIEIYNYIETEIASKLARVLTRRENSIENGLIYCINEILRNIYEHSKSKELWYAGQYWPSRDLIEIAILDEGLGISETLKRNKKLEINNNFDALNLSTMPGISKRLSKSKAYDIYSNSGFGLYMLKSICNEIGNFVICSNDSCIISDKTGTENISTSFKGTAIRIRIKASEVSKIEDIMTKSKEKGQMIYEKYEEVEKISLDIINHIMSSENMVE